MGRKLPHYSSQQAPSREGRGGRDALKVTSAVTAPLHRASLLTTHSPLNSAVDASSDEHASLIQSPPKRPTSEYNASGEHFVSKP